MLVFFPEGVGLPPDPQTTHVPTGVEPQISFLIWTPWMKSKVSWLFTEDQLTLGDANPNPKLWGSKGHSNHSSMMAWQLIKEKSQLDV